MGNFFQELKRRKVYNTATYYVAASWLLLQVFDTLFPAFELPEEAIRIPALILLIGFPIALLLSWTFEVTSEGIKFTEDAKANETVTFKTKDYALSVVLVALLVVVSVQQVVIFNRSRTTGNEGGDADVLLTNIDSDEAGTESNIAAPVQTQALSQQTTVVNQVTYSGQVTSARISPDAQFLAFTNEGEPQVWIQDLLSGEQVAVAPPARFDPSGNVDCEIESWAPTSDQLVAKCRSDTDVSFFTTFRTGSTAREFYNSSFHYSVFWNSSNTKVSFIWPTSIDVESQGRRLDFAVLDYDARSRDPIQFEGYTLADQWITSVSIADNMRITLTTQVINSELRRIYIGNLNTGELIETYQTENRILHAETHGDMVYLLFEQGEQSALARFDRFNLNTPDILVTGDYVDFSVADDNTVALVRDITSSNLWTATQQADGSYESSQLTFGTRHHAAPRFSNDGANILFDRTQGGSSNIHKIDLASNSEQQLTFFTSAESSRADWSPNNRLIALTSNQAGIPRLWLMGNDGTNLRQLDTSPISTDSLDVRWASGNQIAFQVPGNTTYRIFNLAENSEAPLYELHDLLDTDLVVDANNPALGWSFEPAFTPDGQRFAVYWNRPSGRGLWLFEKGENPQLPSQLSGNRGPYAVFQHIDAEPYRGQTIRLTARARFQPVRIGERQLAWYSPFIGLRILTEDYDNERTGASTGNEISINRTLLTASPRWDTHSLEVEVPTDAELIRVFGGLSGEGTLLLDSFSLSHEASPGTWEEIEIANGDFELGTEDGLPINWLTHNRPLGHHESSVVSGEEAAGSALQIKSLPHANREPVLIPLRWSSDGTQLFVRDREGDAWSYSLADESFTRLTSYAQSGGPSSPDIDVSPDGSKVVYVLRSGQSDAWILEPSIE